MENNVPHCRSFSLWPSYLEHIYTFKYEDLSPHFVLQQMQHDILITHTFKKTPVAFYD